MAAGSTKGDIVLHPRQFQVGQAWIAFNLNEQPIITKQDGGVDFLALMDAASCYLLAYAPIATQSGEPSQEESRHLLEDGRGEKKRWPKTLLLSSEQPATHLVAEAESLGIDVVRVSEAELFPLIGEARQAFAERFG
jgi:hypothetical protein